MLGNTTQSCHKSLSPLSQLKNLTRFPEFELWQQILLVIYPP